MEYYQTKVLIHQTLTTNTLQKTKEPGKFKLNLS